MNPILGQCPVCHQQTEVTRLYCRQCDTTIEGHFALGRFYELSPDQLALAEMFIRCEGKINRVGEELGLSYPAVRARLNELIRALGYEVGEESPAIFEEERKAVLADLAQGKITSEEAVARLRGE
ncbi:MAG: DUF2089 domain-containing protein [Thermoflexales bacterium]|nr:DUF2089 domain-containing protein [Thermoflexales bacterium]